jgi:hypothetical protein
VADVSDRRVGLAPDDAADTPRLARHSITRAFSPERVAEAPSPNARENTRSLVIVGENAHFIYGNGPGSNLICTADALAGVMASLRPGSLGAGLAPSHETIHAATVPVHGADGTTVQSGMALGYTPSCEPTTAPNGWRFGPWPGSF